MPDQADATKLKEGDAPQQGAPSAPPESPKPPEQEDRWSFEAEQKFSIALKPTLIRAYQMAARRNHYAACAEHFIEALTLDHPDLFERDNKQAIRKVCNSNYPTMPIISGRPDPHKVGSSRWLKAWMAAAAKIAAGRVPENQTLTLEDFFFAARDEAELEPASDLFKIRNILQQERRSLTKPISRMISEGFQQTDLESKKIQALATGVGIVVTSMHREMRDEFNHAKLERAAIKTDTEGVSPMLAIARVAIPISIFAAIALGSITGLLVRLQFGLSWY